MCQIEVSFICSIRIFSDRETLELLGTVPLVFICDYCKCRRLSEPYFLSFGWRLSSFFHVCIATYILQFSTGTVPLSLCDCHTMLLHELQTSFLPFISYITLLLCGLPQFLLFLKGTVSLFFVWMSNKYPCVSIISQWTLHFVSFWVITDPLLFLSCVHWHTSFLKWKLHLLYLFFHFW